MKFDSRAHIIGAPFADLLVPHETVKNEPMFFNASLAFAYEQGGSITRSFIERFEDALPSLDLSKCVFDSRVHMLMPGWFPCIPGYHHDDVSRGADGQPNYASPEYRSQHVCGLVNGHVCPTEFALGTAEVSEPGQHELVYKAWNDELEEALADGTLERKQFPSGALIRFDCDTFHTGVRAVANGWRWFGRVSWDTDRAGKITNEIRRQVQVYLEFPMEGW